MKCSLMLRRNQWRCCTVRTRMHCSTGPFVDVISVSDHAMFAEQLAPCTECAMVAQVTGSHDDKNRAETHKWVCALSILLSPRSPHICRRGGRDRCAPLLWKYYSACLLRSNRKCQDLPGVSAGLPRVCAEHPDLRVGGLGQFSDVLPTSWVTLVV